MYHIVRYKKYNRLTLDHDIIFILNIYQIYFRRKDAVVKQYTLIHW